MIVPVVALLSLASLGLATPTGERRAVASLDATAFAEAQQRDNTAVRAFSSSAIKTSDGQCLFVDELSGDFRANLTPVQIAACDGSTGQQWDVITSGEHIDTSGAMLVVNTLTQACLNFDPRRAAGNTVIMFSCGGRADGGGSVTNSQEFSFAGGAGPLAFAPLNAVGTCLAVTGSVIDQAPCNPSDPNQSFTIGDGTGAAAGSAPASSAAASSTVAAASSVVSTEVAIATSAAACGSPTTFVTVTAASSVAAVGTAAASSSIAKLSSSIAALSSSIAAASSVSSAVSASAVVTGAAGLVTDAANPTDALPVSGAGGVLQPSAAAESNPRDNTAVRAFAGASVKSSSSGLCLFVDPLAGDFRQNLITITMQECDGSLNEQFDFITSGVHNNLANSTLVVSSLTQGCLNFDPRRAAGNTVITFSCGGRADGGGLVTNSQLFTFTDPTQKTLTLQPENGDGSICLFDNNGKLDSTNCVAGDASQTFTIA